MRIKLKSQPSGETYEQNIWGRIYRVKADKGLEWGKYDRKKKLQRAKDIHKINKIQGTGL